MDTETSSIRWIDCKRLKKLDMRLDFCFFTALVAGVVWLLGTEMEEGLSGKEKYCVCCIQLSGDMAM